MNQEKNQHDDLTLVYDKECPVCKFYCNRISVVESAGMLELVDARDESTIMNEITSAGLNIDQGMVLKKNDKLYYGADALNELAKIGHKKGGFNRINTLFFRSNRLARLMYPLFKYFRNVLLKILGKKKINNLNTNQSSPYQGN